MILLIAVTFKLNWSGLVKVSCKISNTVEKNWLAYSLKAKMSILNSSRYNTTYLLKKVKNTISLVCQKKVKYNLFMMMIADLQIYIYVKRCKTISHAKS